MLVTLEGLDGCGKTTAWRTLAQRFPDATFTREPTETWYGEAVRRAVDDSDSDPLAELFLYCADHAAHLAETVRPALEAGRLVVSDRYLDSRLAYQGATLAPVLDEPMAYVRTLHEPFTVVPDLTCYLEVDVEEAVARSERATKFEDPTFLREVRRNYDRLVERDPGRFAVIDASQPPAAVADAIAAAIESARG